MAHVTLPVAGMTCGNCVQKLSAALQQTPGVRRANVELQAAQAEVDFDADRVDPAELRRVVQRAGFIPGESPDAPPRNSSPPPSSAAAPSEVLLELPVLPAAGGDADSSAASQRAADAHAADAHAADGSRDLAADTESLAHRGADEVLRLDIAGMHCASCVARVQTALESVAGVRQASVNLAMQEAAVHLDPGKSAVAVVRAVERAGYQASLRREGDSAYRDRQRDRERRTWWVRFLSAALALAAIMALPHAAPAATAPVVVFLIAAAVQWGVGWPFHQGAWRRLLAGGANMDTLVSIGSSAAWIGGVLGMVSGGMAHMRFMDSAMIITFISLGRYLEARARGAASQAMRGLLQLRPQAAWVLRDGKAVETPIDQVRAGEMIQVRPGDRVPLDAKVTRGVTEIEQSWLTGESMPVVRRVGEDVSAGAINLTAAIEACVTREVGQTTLDQVVELVRRAAESKPSIQRLADRVVAWFTPVVLLIGLLTLLGWTLAGDASQGWRSAIAVLVVACPCAMGLATPAAILVGGGRAAQRGILMKDAQALEAAARVTLVALDKTGTLTRGRPVVREVIVHHGASREQVLELAAAAEARSNHPLAKAILLAAGEAPDLRKGADFHQEPGKGVRLHWRGEVVVVGSSSWLRDNHVEPQDAPSATTLTRVHVAQGERYLGAILLEDELPEDHLRAVRDLHGLGVRLAMLTGDRQAVAEAIAARVGIDEVRADLLPGMKQDAIAQWQDDGEIVAMVGDGVNDAPALSLANLGIAMGRGADIAAESADVVILRGGVPKVVETIRIARSVLRVIRQNLAWAFGYNLVLIPVAAGVFAPWSHWTLPPAAAAAAMALSSVSVVVNSLRLRNA